MVRSEGAAGKGWRINLEKSILMATKNERVLELGM